jgi:hypothetical protein
MGLKMITGETLMRNYFNIAIGKLDKNQAKIFIGNNC